MYVGAPFLSHKGLRGRRGVLLKDRWCLCRRGVALPGARHHPSKANQKIPPWTGGCQPAWVHHHWEQGKGMWGFIAADLVGAWYC